MGWLFAVALGLHRGSRTVVLVSLVPIAVGHALAVAFIVLAVVLLDRVIDQRAISVFSGLVLIGWAAYHRLYGSRHRVRVGMRTGLAGLVLWSFLMASAHGAGLMLIPIMLPLGHGGSHAGHLPPTESLLVGLGAIGVHSAAMLAVTGAVAVAVYEWLGVAFLRRGWINLDLLWTAVLAATGGLLLVTASR
jgi:hypothetical protein